MPLPQFDAAARRIILKKFCVEAYNQCNDNVLARLRGHESKAVASRATLEVICVPRMCIICLKSFQQFQSCPIIVVAGFTQFFS